jgi:spore germination cell wall hydrolase CwlJ-like protein
MRLMKLANVIGITGSLAILTTAAILYWNSSKPVEAALPDPSIEFTADFLIQNQPLEPIPTRHTTEDLQCLALNIYFEARNESDLAQRAVAWVTINRAYHTGYPNSLCGVVWDSRQFSWTHDGKSDRPTDHTAWNRAQTIAAEMILNYKNTPDPTEGAIMYHADYSNPYWRKSYTKVVQIDSHIFYREKSQ